MFTGQSPPIPPREKSSFHYLYTYKTVPMILRIVGLTIGLVAALLLAIHAYYYLSGRESPLREWVGPLILLTILSGSFLRHARRQDSAK